MLYCLSRRHTGILCRYKAPERHNRYFACTRHKKGGKKCEDCALESR
jgi:hypothetical protein